MRFKYYLRGCGLGILLATIVLAVWFSTHKTVMTDDDVVARAEELGMVFEDEAETEEDETEAGAEESLGDSDDGAQAASAQDADDAENDEADAEEIAQESTGIEDSDGEDEAEPDENADENSGEDEEEEEEAEAADENAGDGEVTVVSFTIEGGQYARAISENLYEAGLVDDAEEFRIFMQDNDYDNNIQVGTYELSTDMSYEDIAKIITTKTR
ncbi:MAG: endolytic transglycosylase MltG [Clostridiales bacterium]|nr:endolytic transglycosylase MltG [Clostridiales bacterium]